MTAKIMIGVGRYHTVGLKSDGTCVAAGYNYTGECNVGDWSDIIAIGVGRHRTVGLKSDGTCVRLGSLENTESDINNWSDIIDINVGVSGIVGLKSDGTWISNRLDISSWSDIIAIGVGDYHTTIGIKSDGTCVSNGFDVSSWSDIIAASVGYEFAVGLKSDGTCVAVGDDKSLWRCNVGDWSDIIAINAGFYHTVGLKSDGTCVATGTNAYNCDRVSNWSDIIGIYAGDRFTVGLKRDGTCVAVGDNGYGQCNISNWSLKLHKQGLITSKTGLNCLSATAVEGFNLSGSEPSGTNRRVIFNIDGTYNKLTQSSGVASLSAVATQTPTVDSVLSEGNTVAELGTITSIPVFVGKTVYPAIALYAPAGAEVMPSLGLSLKTKTNQDRYQDEQISPEYPLADIDVDIVSVTADVTTTGQATANVMVSLKQSGTWSGWMTMIATKGQKASAIKYKGIYTVSALGGADTAKIDKVSVIYCAGSSTVSGDTAELLTITQDYDNDLQFAQCMVKHKPLMDAQIKAFVAFRSAPQKQEMINIGTGNGETQTVTLTDVGINHNTLSVQFDGKPVYDYGYNTETSQITFTAATGVAVTATYEHGWEAEEWLPMIAQEPQVYNDTGLHATKFTYTLPDNVTGKTISNTKVQLYRPSGTVTDQVLGMATGQRQLFVLPHYAKKETITSNAQFSYDDESRVLTVVGVKDSEIKVSYIWMAETHEVRGLVAGWAE